MPPTNVRDPSYFHKVVDCQWACPAHTDVPEYIRLIAQGRFTDAYLLNRASNVFPGILGRTCDRPCEPACRRGRVDGQPVAICRLKRVAADHRDVAEVIERLPRAPARKNGKRVACIGAGPSSLTVANDLLPLGYDVTILEKLPKPGGLMRSNIPAFRLPESVLDDEIEMILQMGASVRYGHPVESLRGLLDAGEFDAVFIGTGAPRGRDLELPGRRETDQVFVGVEWLQGVAFGHVTSIGERVIIIGVGNTAMDCCRTALRLGGETIKATSRRTRPYFEASPWELEDAEEERVEMLTDLSPKAYVVEAGKLVGVTFEKLAWSDESGKATSRVVDTVFVPADAVILAIGQEATFPWIERDLGVAFDERGAPVVDPRTFQSTRPGVFFGGDAALGPKNIIWAVEQGHQAAISIDNHCHGVAITERPAPGMSLASTKMSLHEWAYSNDYSPTKREKMSHVELTARFKSLSIEVEKGFTLDQTIREVERCLNCDVETVFADKLCIECDACVDVCPLSCLTITREGPEAELRTRLSAPATNAKQSLFSSGPLPQTKRVMVKDEDVCVRCGLCAERCPTAAWDMQLFTLTTPHAGATR